MYCNDKTKGSIIIIQAAIIKINYAILLEIMRPIDSLCDLIFTPSHQHLFAKNVSKKFDQNVRRSL